MLLGSCKTDEGEDIVVPPVETVEQPKAVVPYVGSSEMKSDTHLLVEMVAKIVNMRWQYYINCTGGFDAAHGFKAEFKASDWDRYLEVASGLANNADKYMAAVDRLTAEGVLRDEGVMTRGISKPSLTSLFGSVTAVNDALASGQQKIMAVMRQPGMKNQEQWKAAFDAVPKELRLGETDWKKWRQRIYENDFGNALNNNLIGSRIFMALCGENSNERSMFPDVAQELFGGHPAWKHVNEVGVVCHKAGRDVYIAFLKGEFAAFSALMDGVDIGMASVKLANAIDRGDPKETREAMLTITNVVATQVGGSETGASYWRGESVNMAMEGLNRTIFNDLADAVAAENGEPVKGTDTSVLNINDIDEESGAEVFIVDTQGGVTLAVGDKGQAVMPLNTNGQVTVTAVDGNGNTGTATVSAKGGQTVNVEVSTQKSEAEELPQNGQLKLSRDELNMVSDEDSYEVRVTTNYRYYGFTADKSWITVKALPNSNKLNVSVTMNTEGDERQGNVYVMATDRSGKVLKTARVKVFQQSSGWGLTVDPEELRFAFNGYEKSAHINLTGFKYFFTIPESSKDNWLYSYDHQGLTYTDIIVTPNETGKERRATFYAWGTNTDTPTGDGDIYFPTPITVIQEPEGTVTVQPESLSFDNKGGSALMKVTMSGYSRLGTVIDTDGHGWLEVTPSGSDMTIAVTCSKNDTGKERTGHFYVFGTNFDDPLVGDIKACLVEVTQGLNTSLPVVSLVKLQLTGKMSRHYVDKTPREVLREVTLSDFYTVGGIFSTDEGDEIRVTRQGKGIRIESGYDKDYVEGKQGSIGPKHYIESEHFSIDIPDFSKGFDGAVASIDYSWNYSKEDVENPLYLDKDDGTFSCTNFKFNGSYSIKGDCNKADGTKVSNVSKNTYVSFPTAYSDRREQIADFKFIDDDNWSVFVMIYSEEGSASSRAEHPQRVQRRQLSNELLKQSVTVSSQP